MNKQRQEDLLTISLQGQENTEPILGASNYM